jgi:myo-inositol-1(or 4)-monophosphatase
VSIALVHKGVITHGVIYDPSRNDLYTASRGRGAYLNDKRLRVSRRDKLIDALVGNGYFPSACSTISTPMSACSRDFMTKTAGVPPPRLGSTRPGRGGAPGVWTDSGRSAWRPGIWQAGCLMITESRRAGRGSRGERGILPAATSSQATPKIFCSGMLQLIKPHLSPALRSKGA